jgi:hypothetical protein
LVGGKKPGWDVGKSAENLTSGIVLAGPIPAIRASHRTKKIISSSGASATTTAERLRALLVRPRNRE